MTLDADMVGQVLAGRYRLEEQIAVGGMGTVWRARDEVLERPVAIKLLHDSLADDESASERFRREALTAASISHPNMANVFDYVQDEGRPGIVMELIESETLARRISRDGPLPIPEAVRIADGVLAALDAAHRAGIVHRDIKPANILLTPTGDVKVADFGIARSLGDSSLTSTGMVMGTAHYSAPEQVRGDNASPSTDLYSAGVVLYEMLTARRPFEGDTPVAVALARLSEDPPPPKRIRSEIPVELEAVVLRALARDPGARFSSAEEMRGVLAGAMPEALDPTSAFEAGPLDETIAYARSVGAGGGTTVRRMRRERRSRPEATVLPPAWASKRLALVMLPLLAVVGLVAFLAWFSGRPVTVAVPDFKGKTIAEARQIASDAGLEVRFRQVRSTRPKDTVVRQDVAPGTMVQEGEALVLSLSDGTPACCTVPSLVGKSEEQAKDMLKSARLELGDVTHVITEDAPEGTVVGQDPPAGERLDPGDDVNVTIAKKPEERGKGKGKGREEGDD